jgi:putative salt-induced outer membrane protein YdiY
MSQDGKSVRVSTIPVDIIFPCHMPTIRFVRRNVLTGYGRRLLRSAVLSLQLLLGSFVVVWNRKQIPRFKTRENEQRPKAYAFLCLVYSYMCEEE